MTNADPVNRGKGLTDFDSEADRRGWLEAVVGNGLQHVCKVGAVNQFHDDGEGGGLDDHVSHSDDRVVGDGHQDVALLDEAPRRAFVIRQFGFEDLDGSR